MKPGRDVFLPVPHTDAPAGDTSARRTDRPSPESGRTDELFTKLYDELHDLASVALRSERHGHTLQTTALVHEAYLRLARENTSLRGSRQTFLAAASCVVRRVLVDYARRRNTKKRGGDFSRIALDLGSIGESGAVGLIDLHDSLCRLEQLNRRHGRVVEMRFFGGLSESEIADILGVSRSSVARDWRWARAWLMRELTPAPAAATGDGCAEAPR